VVADHRNLGPSDWSILKGCKEFEDYLAPLQGCNQRTRRSGGLRFAPTSGYFLTSLRVVIPGGAEP